jgi:hypothetical protein
MKKLINLSLKFIKNSIHFLFFLLRLAVNHYYRNPIEKKHSGTVAVLANGPSLKEELSNLTLHKSSAETDYIVLNYFAFDDSFFLLKPSHYCLADPMFFQSSVKEADAKRLFQILEQRVDWKINLYIPSHYYKKFIEYSEIKNKNIRIIKINTTRYEGFESLRHFFYKNGLAMPPAQTVANLAIFVCLNSGYQQLNVYGVDHSFFESLCVNDENQLCNKNLHFYSNGQPELKPIIRYDNDQIFKVSEYLNAMMKIFQSHELLAKYSEYLKVEIINCTKSTMIDSYKRGRQ